MNAHIDFVFHGSHPAMDFLNTLYSPAGSPEDTLVDGGRLLDWLVAAELLDLSTATRLRKRLEPRALDEAAVEARKLRAWLGGWIERWKDAPETDYSAEIRRLNGLLRNARNFRQVLKRGESLQLVEDRNIDTGEQLCVLIAETFAALISDENPDLVRHCAGPDCTIWFLDRTKSHARRFCSAAACGNRSKVAAFRLRNRTN